MFLGSSLKDEQTRGWCSTFDMVGAWILSSEVLLRVLNAGVLARNYVRLNQKICSAEVAREDIRATD
jgi:hypothetical protein